MPLIFLSNPYGFRRILTILLILLPVVCNAAERQGEAYFDFGIFAFEEGDFEGAEQNFSAAARINPKQAEYHHYLGKTYLKIERFKEAEKSLNLAWKYKSDLEGLKYDMALVQYRLGMYPAATHLFAEELSANPSNALAQYYIGICMYKRKQFQNALEHFIHASHKSPSIKPNGYFYAGICHVQLVETEKAVEKFSWVVQNAPPGELKKNASKWLSSAQAIQRADDPLRLNLKISSLYDDNVALEPVDQDIYADEGDFGVTAFFSGKYRLIRHANLSAGIGYSHYQSLYADLNEYNLMGLIPNAYLKVNHKPWTLGVTVQPIYYWLDNDKYMLRNQAGVDLYWSITERFSNRYAVIFYDETNYITKGRSGQNVQLLIDGYYQLPERKLSFLGGIGYDQKSTDHSNYKYYGLQAKISMSWELPHQIIFSPSGKFYTKQYAHLDSNYQKKRDDVKLDLSASVSRNIFYSWLTGSIEYKFTKNDSNIDAYSYQSNKIGFALTASY